MNIKRFDFHTAPELCLEFGMRLKQQRLLKNLSQDELASKAGGLGNSTIQRFEQGKGGTFENFLRIVMALGLSRELESLLMPAKNSIEEIINLQTSSQRQRASRKGKA